MENSKEMEILNEIETNNEMEILNEIETNNKIETNNEILTCFIWFCLGFLATFGYKIHEKSAKIFVMIFTLSGDQNTNFGLIFEIILISLYFSGILIAFLLFPVSIFWLQIFLNITCFMFLLMILPSAMLVKLTPESAETVRLIFYILNGFCSFGIGVITMTGASLITDGFVGGKTSLKLLFYLLSYPVAEFASDLANNFFYSFYHGYLNGFGKRLAKFMSYELAIILLIYLVTSFLIYSFGNYKDPNHKIWMKSNVTNKTNIFKKALKVFIRQPKSIFLLLISNITYGVFQIYSMLYLVNVVDGQFAYLTMLSMTVSVFDFIGRLISGLVRIRMEKRLCPDDSEPKTEVCYLSPMLIIWLLVISQIIILLVTCYSLAIDLPGTLGSFFSHNIALLMSCFFGLVRGLVGSIVYYRASNVKVNNILEVIIDDVLTSDDVNLVKCFGIGFYVIIEAVTLVLIKITNIYFIRLVQRQMQRH
uniref:Transporter, putative n=1 Tax=Theileria annulata TaxID=5874 RepID=A0A3B0N2T5_THEAN